MTRRMLLLVAGAFALGVMGLGIPTFSTAAYTGRTTNTGAVTGAADWTPPTVTVQDPGSPLKGTVTVAATAADSGSGIQGVSLQYLPSGGSSWTTLCTAIAAPYSCSWNTTAVTDGGYDLRAVATDRAGYSTTSSSTATTVANNLLVVLGSAGEVVRGTVSLPTTLYAAGTTTYTVRVEYAPSGSTNWKSICTSLSSPYTCSWNTTTFANGDYDLRAVATAGNTSTTSTVVEAVLVDNLAPVVTMTDPGTPLAGVVTLAATASDTHSGVGQVVIQAAVNGTGSWATLSTVTTTPFSCRYDTAQLTDGSYSLRAVATDAAGNATISGGIPNRVVDNTVSSVSMDDPGAFLSGTVSLTANASSTAGVTSVRIQRAPGGTATWTDLCTDTTAPFACTWDTTGVADGLYDFRAVLVDGTGKVTTSTTISGRRVDNSPLRGYDVQAANGGATGGRLEANDSLTFTYNGQINLATVAAGWAGAATAVRVRVRDGNLLAIGAKGDTLDVQLTSGVTVNLGSVVLKDDYVKSNKTAIFNATMTAGTTTVAGATATVITLRLGTLASGSGIRTTSSNAAAAMVWTPSSAVSDPTGRVCSTAPVTESGALDREF